MNRLVLPGKLDSLAEIRRFVERAAAAAGLDSDRTYGLGLAVDEITTNIIIHGYEENRITGNVVILAEMTATELNLILEDTSPPFDPRAIAPPKDQLDKPLEERPIGGLGVYLALQSVHRFEYTRNGNVNRGIFTMNRGGQPRA